MVYPMLIRWQKHLVAPKMGYKGCLFWADQTLKAVESAEIFRKVAAPNSRIRYQPEKHKNLLKGE